ncbi:MAG: RidA family protein [Nitrospinota bacterium]|jgi:enamine deaminase RidA (YjgF/YER057c/UK114 family)|nr:RidA family protein [Nitrospinota bacterium]
MGAEVNIQSLGLDLPPAPAPVGAYVPYVLSGSLLFISGQIPLREGNMLHPGKVSREVGVEEAQECARQCFLNALAQAKAALGSLDRVARVVRMSGFVASSEGFTDQAVVMNAASEMAVQVFGDAGTHARLAIGVAELPLGASVELEVILEVNGK